jgi:hypothetical protein
MHLDRIAMLEAHAPLYFAVTALQKEGDRMNSEKPDYLSDAEFEEVNAWEPEDQEGMFKTPYEEQDEVKP